MKITLGSEEIEKLVHDYYMRLGVDVSYVKYVYKENITEDGWDFSDFKVIAVVRELFSVLGKMRIINKEITNDWDFIELLIKTSFEEDKYDITNYYAYNNRVVIELEEKKNKTLSKKGI